MTRASKSLLFRFALALFLTAGLFVSDFSFAAPATVPETRSVHASIFLTVDRSEIVEVDAPAATVFIANPEIADVQVVTPTRIMVFGKKAGETTLIVSGDNGKLLAQRTVSVRPNLSELQRALLAISPDHPIRAEAVPGGLILSGEAATAAVVEEARRLAARYVPSQDGDIINRIRINANDQIQIRVRFAEVSRDVDKRLGINWENAAKIGSFTLGLATGADFYNAGTITRSVVDGAANDAITGSFSNKHVSINGMIDALAQDGLVSILAEPSLTALSGETASFLAGGEFPVPIPQSGDTITIEWKQYGVSLAFTPTIIGENRINLHVRPEVSQLSSVGAITMKSMEVPALTTRRAETTIELNSGQSFALAGLLNNQQNQSIEKFPFLGDLPILGALFRSSRFQNNESELVIIITPYIVKPTTQERLALPTDNFAPPSDSDFFFKMRQTNSDPNARPLSGAPRAVRVEEMDIKDAPEPTAAPREPVAREIEPTPTPRALPPPMSTPVPKKTEKLPPKAAIDPAPAVPASPRPSARKKPAALAAPSGPGGFIME